MNRISMRVLTLFVIAVSLPLPCLSQNQGNIWYFGNGAGADFNSGAPVALTDGQTYLCTTQQHHNEGSSAISDSSGTLLFYCDGATVWNKDHQVMPNGSGLLGNVSSTQSCIIVPQPKSSRYFYIFTTDAWYWGCGGSLGNGFRYSVVDICADNQKGDVDPSRKNTLLIDTVSEKVAVARHANGVDYWVLAHRFFSNEFHAFLLTPDGITDTVVTAIGGFHGGSISQSMGQMKFSPNGQRIALAIGNGAIGSSGGFDALDLFDFDKSTGIVSNWISLGRPNNNNMHVFGVEFSPSSTKLYATGISAPGSVLNWLFQYDLAAAGGNIDASMSVIHRGGGLIDYKGLQLGPDGKIYFVSNSNSTYLSVINAPNNLGLACDFQNSQVPLAGRGGSYCLPTFIAGYDYSNTASTDCGLAGIAEAPRDPVSIHPTVATDRLMIEVPRQARVDIFNTDGKHVRTSSVPSGRTGIDVSGLSIGLYVVRIHTDATTVVGKFMKE